MFAALFADRQQLQGPIYRARVIVKIQFLVRKNCAIDEKKVHIRLEKYTFLIKEECTSVHKKSTLFQKEMLKPFGLSIFFYRTKTILSTKNIRKYTHEYATSILQNTHICCAKYSHSNTKYIATNLQQHNIQKTKTILLQCKNHTFARQKPYFCTPKRGFLHAKNPLFVFRQYNKHVVNVLRIFHEMVANTHEMPTKTHETPNEHPRNVQRTIREMPTKHSARRRGRFIAPVSLHYQKRVFP